jgi:hypothetical protein
MEYLNEIEKDKLNSFDKVIIWGYPLHTHTQSYLHAMWEKVFKYLGKETYWFHDNNYNKDFTYDNCLFITEAYGDNNIPLNPTSVYFVNFCYNPKKYLEKRCRLIDLRFNVDEMHDCNYNFKIKNPINLSDTTRYEKLTNDEGVAPEKRNNKITDMNYEAVYMYWATDLLPCEINLELADDKNLKKNIIYYIGSPHNSKNFISFKIACRRKKINVVNVNPWEKPISFEENMKLMRQSILSPDFRPIGNDNDVKQYGIKNGKNHLEIGYLPCRVLKTISYGRLGITDSLKVKEILGEHVEYNSDMNKLLDKCLVEKDNIDRIKKAMLFIKENHTYIHRVRDMMRALLI